ncbi:uncharacterized protein LOC129320828 [Prosopis cineraria]|uniref:uncharacterized protein LOC129320828 n=1 Tax=Prosopis cineraria TaxID=364024 RepID=UPI00240FB886|nr:uncharacterized protein LOC129320828 [Prosopis cineraria]
MASTLTPVCPVVIQASASSGHRRPDQDRRKGSSSSWWTPIFGWSSEPDYIDSNNNKTADRQERSESAVDSKSKPGKPRFAGCFTEDKARQLRLMTMETFPDTMYRSAIASRLASDFKTPSDP